MKDNNNIERYKLIGVLDVVTTVSSLLDNWCRLYRNFNVKIKYNED